MEHSTFDRLTRAFGFATSRRGVVAGIAGIIVSGKAISTCAAQSATSGTDSPGATPAPGTVNAFRSDKFGYYLTALVPWKVDSYTTTAQGDKLVLGNGASSAFFSGLADTAKLQHVFDQMKSSFFTSQHASNVVAVPSSDALANTDQRITATFTYRTTSNSAAAADRTASITCLSLTPGASALSIIHDVASNDAKAQQAQFADLVAHLVIPLSGVKTYTGLSHQHTLGRVTYPEVPPVGGPHNPVWQNCGFYDTPIANEHAVHSMEHGAIWITFLPNLPTNQVAIIRQLAESMTYVLASPYPGIPSPVVASTWSAQLHLADADEIRLRSFIATYQYGPDTEQGAPCSGGTSSPTF